MPNDGTNQLTLSVPEAGKKYFDLGRNASYAAAVKGQIPTIRIGHKLRVPVRAVEHLLDSVPKARAIIKSEVVA
jgi:hypothetical protein